MLTNLRNYCRISNKNGIRLLSGGADLGVQPSVPPVDIVQRANVPDGIPQGFESRHGRSGKTVAVFGATGFLGGYVVQELANKGHNIVIATRGDDTEWRHLKPCADYGKLAASYISMKDEKSVRDTVKGADIVVNLMGKYYETKRFPTVINCSYEDVHIKAAETLARISREEDVKHLVHVSCAYASSESESRYATTKAEGEKLVESEFPGAVIVRPNIMYGQEDRFLNTLGLLAEWLPYMPLINGGTSKISPVYVSDVGTAVSYIASDYHTAGNTYNLSGNDEYTWKEIYEYVLEQTQRPTKIIDLPLEPSLLLAKAVNFFPWPWVVPEEVKVWQEDAIGPKPSEKTFKDLNMEPTKFELRAHQFLYRFIFGGHFVDKRSDRPEHS